MGVISYGGWTAGSHISSYRARLASTGNENEGISLTLMKRLQFLNIHLTKEEDAGTGARLRSYEHLEMMIILSGGPTWVTFWYCPGDCFSYIRSQIRVTYLPRRNMFSVLVLPHLPQVHRLRTKPRRIAQNCTASLLPARRSFEVC